MPLFTRLKLTVQLNNRVKFDKHYHKQFKNTCMYMRVIIKLLVISLFWQEFCHTLGFYELALSLGNQGEELIHWESQHDGYRTGSDKLLI